MLKERKFYIKKAAAAVGLAAGMLLTACGSKGDADTKVVLTTGFGKDEIFRIEGISCTLPEIMVYLTTTRTSMKASTGLRYGRRT